MKALFVRLRRFFRTRRRLIAALLAGVAVWAGLTVLRPPPPSTTGVLVTTRALSGGSSVVADDVQVRDLPTAVLPAAYLNSPEQAIGRPVTVALPAGAILLPSTVVSRDALAGPGMAVLPVTLIASASGLIEVGDRIDLIASDEDGSAPVASAARVVAVLAENDEGGALGGSRSGGPIVLVELRPNALTAVAAAAARGPLGFGFR